MLERFAPPLQPVQSYGEGYLDMAAHTPLKVAGGVMLLHCQQQNFLQLEPVNFFEGTMQTDP